MTAHPLPLKSIPAVFQGHTLVTLESHDVFLQPWIQKYMQIMMDTEEKDMATPAENQSRFPLQN